MSKHIIFTSSSTPRKQNPMKPKDDDENQQRNKTTTTTPIILEPSSVVTTTSNKNLGTTSNRSLLSIPSSVIGTHQRTRTRSTSLSNQNQQQQQQEQQQQVIIKPERCWLIRGSKNNNNNNGEKERDHASSLGNLDGDCDDDDDDDDHHHDRPNMVVDALYCNPPASRPTLVVDSANSRSFFLSCRENNNNNNIEGLLGSGGGSRMDDAGNRMLHSRRTTTRRIPPTSLRHLHAGDPTVVVEPGAPVTTATNTTTRYYHQHSSCGKFIMQEEEESNKMGLLCRGSSTSSPVLSMRRHPPTTNRGVVDPVVSTIALSRKEDDIVDQEEEEDDEDTVTATTCSSSTQKHCISTLAETSTGDVLVPKSNNVSSRTTATASEPCSTVTTFSSSSISSGNCSSSAKASLPITSSNGTTANGSSDDVTMLRPRKAKSTINSLVQHQRTVSVASLSSIASLSSQSKAIKILSPVHDVDMAMPQAAPEVVVVPSDITVKQRISAASCSAEDASQSRTTGINNAGNATNQSDLCIKQRVGPSTTSATIRHQLDPPICTDIVEANSTSNKVEHGTERIVVPGTAVAVVSNTGTVSAGTIKEESGGPLTTTTDVEENDTSAFDPDNATPPTPEEVELGVSTTASTNNPSETRIGTLTEAVVVDEEAEKAELVRAEDFHRPRGGEKRRQLSYRQRLRLAILICILCMILAGLIAVTLVYSRRDGNDEESFPTGNVIPVPPTPIPPTIDELHLRTWLDAQNISQATLDSAPVAYDMAIRWYANNDRSRDRSTNPLSDDSWDFTRFILTWFYFIASSNGTKPWVSCNPPDYDWGQTDDCIYYKVKKVSWDGSYVNYTQMPSKRWLSNSSYCDWPGIDCFATNAVPDDNKFAVCNGGVDKLSLVGFGLSGPLPVVINQLPCFRGIQLAFNSGLTGTINPEMFNFRTMETDTLFQWFLLNNNTGLYGPIPDQLWEQSSLSRIDLGQHDFTGTLPDLRGKLPGLYRLRLSGNYFGGGPLPLLGGQDRLHSLHVWGDKLGFTGTIPTEYGSLTMLKEFWAFDNLLKGPIPQSFVNLSLMEEFRVEVNQLTGEIPDVYWPNLRELRLSTNKFEGVLPPRLINMTKLTSIDVDENGFSGIIDPRIGDKLEFLEEFIVNNNNLTGPIPPTLANLSRLTSLYVQNNHLTGDVPFEICSLRGPDRLRYILADCLGYPPKNYCFCCTSCCDTSIPTCQPDDPVIKREDSTSRRRLTSTRGGKLLADDEEFSRLQPAPLEEENAILVQLEW